MSLNSVNIYLSFQLTTVNSVEACRLTSTFHNLASPEILKTDIADVTTFDSLPLTWMVEADGIPRPAVAWVHNGEEVKASERIRITDSGVSIDDALINLEQCWCAIVLQTLYKIENLDVKEADAGEWKAVVKNRIGEKSLPCNLTVIRKYPL